MRLRPRAALAAVLVLAACGSPTPPAGAPVPVDGGQDDLRSLAGRWAGEFHNERTGQRGTISFHLGAGRDTAYARVVVSGPGPVAGCDDPVSVATHGPAGEAFVLRLGRLGVSRGSIGGWLVAYRDPVAGCLVDTWFEGLVQGDLLEGLYFSHPADGTSVRLGSWRVRRVR